MSEKLKTKKQLTFNSAENQQVTKEKRGNRAF